MTDAGAALVFGTVAVVGCATLCMRPAPTEQATVAFPPDLEADQVETLLGAVAGLPARARVTMIAEGTAGLLTFGVRAQASDLAALRAGLQGFAPGVRLEDAEAEELPAPQLRAWIGWRGTHVLLRRDLRELSVAALLGALRGAGRAERLRLSVRLRPVVRPKAPPYRREPRRDVISRTLSPIESLPMDQVRAVRNQYAGPLLNARIEVSVWASSVRRARQLLAQVVAVLRARSGPRGRFSARSHRFALPGVGTMLAPAELVALLGWPLLGPDVPGLSFARAPQRLPDAGIPEQGGRCFGVSTWPGLEKRHLHQPAVGALSHTLILGPTGSGKSSLLARLLLDDLDAKRGVLLLDMKGDTVVDVLERVPAKRHRDVVVIDPADSRPVAGLKSLARGAPELTADLWVGLFRNLFADSWGVRSERYIRLGVQTLALQPELAITELPRVFSDPALRRRLLSRSSEPLLASAWATFEALTPAQQAEHLAAPLGKVQDLLARRMVRAVLGQAEPKMTIARAIQVGRIVVVRLAPGLLGPPTAQLLGALTVYEVFQAVLARQGMPARLRVPFGVYIDEPAVMQLSGVPLDALYELARGMGVGITTATQSVSQLPPTVQQAVLSNVATIATFRAGRRDAQLMAGELVGVNAEQLQHLGQYEIAVRLGLHHGQVASVATARTLALPAPINNVERMRELAASRYGVAAEETDAAVRQRWAVAASDADDVPLGRRRRRS